MKRFIFFVYLLVNVVLSSELYFIEPKDGQVVEKTFVVKFGLKDFGVAPAGYDINNTGHHHLLIDVELPDLNKPIQLMIIIFILEEGRLKLYLH